MKKVHFLFIGLVLAFAAISCDKEDSCSDTYDNGVKEIIDRSCAYAGCHAGA